MDLSEQASTCSYDKIENKSVDMSSEDDYPCSSCYSELIPIDTRKLWFDIAQIIKSIYRDNQNIQSESELSKIKEYIQILTQANAEILFEKIESIVLEHVAELRHQLFKHSQTYLQLSNDVQSFITYLLDQYNTFIQSAKQVSNLISYLEENYLKSLHLTWLLYNKHLYETYVYMNKKIQQSMSLMIDLLQPANELSTTIDDCSPAVYTHLLNRFLTFDEEMSEIACLYKDCQSQKQQFFLKRKQKLKKKKKCPKNHSNEKSIPIEEERKPISEVILPPKLPPKFQNDLRTVFTKTEIPPCPSLLTAKIQSVSFTAGTFGSITTTDGSNRSNKLDELIRQATSKEKICDICCCNLLSDSTNCLTCMSINDSLVNDVIHQRETERKERLRIKLSHKRTNENLHEQNQSSIKPNENNIDELVKYIDGNDSTTTTTITTKKNKKKKKNKQKTEIPSEENEDQQINPLTIESISMEQVIPSSKVTETTIEQPLSPDEEVNWITVARKQVKHKPQHTTNQSKVQPTKKPNSNPKQIKSIKCESVVNSNKSQIISTPPTQRAQTTVAPWNNQEQNSNPVVTTSNLVATAPAFIPLVNWNMNNYSSVPGPIQRPTTSFSPAPGSNCIRRPSPTYSTISNSNSDEFSCKHSSSDYSMFTDDFPCYDPFNSGASLKLLTNNFNEQLDDMDAFDKEIEHFKKSYIENISSNNH